MKNNANLMKSGPRPYFRHYAVPNPVQVSTPSFAGFRKIATIVAVFAMLFTTYAPSVFAKDLSGITAVEQIAENADETANEVIMAPEKEDESIVDENTSVLAEDQSKSVKNVIEEKLQNVIAPESCSSRTTPIVVTPTNAQGWSTADTRVGGSVSFIADATGPAQTGALALVTDNTATAKAQYMHATETLLANVSAACYYTKQNSASFNQGVPSYQISVFLNGGTDGFTTLVYEPYYNGTVTPNTWQSWNVGTGNFWSSRSVTCKLGTINGTPGGPAEYDLSEILALCPNAVVVGFGVNVGSNNPAYDTEVEYVRFNNSLYDFEPAPAPKTKIIAQKIVCDDEMYLPNWSGNTMTVNAATAENFLNDKTIAQHCAYKSGWNFQWGYADKAGQEGVDMTTGNWTGLAAAGGNSTGLCITPYCGPNTLTGSGYDQWHTFDSVTNGSTGAEVAIDSLNGSTSLWVREVLKPGYLPFSAPQANTDLAADPVSAEISCHNDVLNYDNDELIENVAEGNTYYCVAFNVAKDIVIQAQKIVCVNEAALPNWGANNIATVNAATAEKFVTESRSNCEFAADWNFQWGYGDGSVNGEGVDMTFGTTVGPADGVSTANLPQCPAPWCGPNTFTGFGYNQWHSFGSATDKSGTTSVVINDLKGADKIWVREELKSGFVPFSAPEGGLTPSSNVSAEIYCHDDAFNYDNYDFIGNPEKGETYYCVAFNAPKNGGGNGDPTPDPRTYEINGVVYNDLNGNGVKEENEPGLSGWEISAQPQSDDSAVTATGSAVSGENGTYSIPKLAAGCYAVTETVQTGFRQTDPSEAEEFKYLVSVGSTTTNYCEDTTVSNVSSKLFALFVKTAQAAPAIIVGMPDANNVDFGNVAIDNGGGNGNGNNNGGGSSSGSNPNNNDDDGQVLGDTTDVPSDSGLGGNGVSPTPAGQVLGASTTLPRTGMPTWVLLMVALLAVPAFGYKALAVKKAN